MLVYFTVSLAVLLGVVGLAVDVGRMQLATTQLQAVAADAAMTAATEFSNGNTNWQTVATSEATSAGAANSLPSVGASFQFGANTGPYAGNQSVIQATVTQSIPLYFMPRHSLKYMDCERTSRSPTSALLLFHGRGLERLQCRSFEHEPTEFLVVSHLCG
jgi:uncharacterized membrane protein